MTSRSAFDAALAAAAERFAAGPGDPWTGDGRLVDALESLARPSTVLPAAPRLGRPKRAYAFLAELRMDGATARSGVPFWAGEWLEDEALPKALTAIDRVPHVRPVADAQVGRCVACGDPVYAVSEEYITYPGDVTAVVLSLCLRCPALAHHAIAGSWCWRGPVAPGPDEPPHEHELVVAVKRGSSNDTFGWLVNRLRSDWRRPGDTHRVYGVRRDSGEASVKFWPIELCDLPVVARYLARAETGPYRKFGTFDDLARAACERCGSLAYRLGEDVGPDQGGQNYDVFDHDLCAQCRHITKRGVMFQVQYPDR